MTPGKDPRAEPDDDDPPKEQIDIATAVRAAKTAAAHGRVPVTDETAKMGAFQLEQALAKLHSAGKEEEPSSSVTNEGDEPPREARVEPEEREPKKEIPIPEPSEPGPMVSSIRDPRPAREARGIPRSTLVLIALVAALIASLYAWSRTLR